MRRRGRAIDLLTSWIVCSGCHVADADRVLPRVESVDGVEVATLDELPGLLDPDYAWSLHVLRRVPTVDGETGKPLVYDPFAAIELRSGALLIHDLSAEQPLVLLDPDEATVLSRFGRRGQGPGELGGTLAMAEIGDTVVVVDAGNRQVHRFDQSGEALASTEFRGDARLSSAAASADGRGFLLEAFRRSDRSWWRTLERVDLASGLSDHFLRLPEPAADAQPGRIQQGRDLWTVVGQHVVTMWSSRPVVYVHDARGRRVREIRLPWTRRSFTERDLQSQLEYSGGRYPSMRLGPAALTNVLYAVSDTVFGVYTMEMWRAAEDPVLEMGPQWWKLFTIRGEYLGTLALPDGFWLLGRSGRTLWARLLDEAGVPVIVEVDLVRGGPSG